jgi:hypothetical protein
MSENTTAERFTERLMEHRSEEQKELYRKCFKLGEGDELVGVRMGHVFELPEKTSAHGHEDDPDGGS